MRVRVIEAEERDRRWSALALIVVAQFMVILDVAIVNVALPSIEVDLGFSQTSLQWVISAYAIMFGGALLLGGRLADLLGRRRLFLVGLGVFSLSSLLCGLAWSEGSLIAFRALQGLGGALLAPAALSLLMTTFADGRERNKALGIYGAASGSGAAAGVLLGGLLTSTLSWPWIFFINVPVGLAAIALTPVLLRESRAELDHRHFDFAGAFSVTAGLMLLVYALTRATTDGWGTPTTLGLLAGSAALVAVFVVNELRSKAPLLPMRIFRLPTLAAANVTMALVGGVAFSEFFVLSLYMQDVLEYSALQSGVAFVAFALTVVIASNIAQAVVGRIGVRPTLTGGLLASAVSVAVLTRLPVDGSYFWDLFPAYVLGGAGMAFAFVPVTIASLAGVGRSDAGVASGLVNTSRQIGGAIGLAATCAFAAAATSNFVDAHPGVAATSSAALVDGFPIAL
jgi:EmrB/QacA subfamily drug resistance transporter